MKNIITLLVIMTCISLQAAGQPNVLFIAVDDMNDWVLGGHPDVHAPNIQGLAARGMSFTNAHSAALKCGPSRTAIFTGQNAATNGFYEDHIYWHIDPSLDGLHSTFQRGGYKTLGTGKLFHHTGGYIDSRNWDRWWLRTDNRAGTDGPQRREGWDLGTWEYGAPVPGDGAVSLYNEHYNEDDEIMEWSPIPNRDEDEMADTQRADWVIEQLGLNHGRPFFLGMGLYSPHSPHYAPRRIYDTYYPNVADIDLPAYWENGRANPLPDLNDLSASQRNRKTNRYEQYMERLKDIPGEDGLRECIRGYLAAITYADEQIGRVLDALEASRYADNTIVVLWSDHGYHLGEKGHWGKNEPWERSSSVPFIWAGPGIAEGVTTDVTVSLVDMYPTFLDMCSLPDPSQALDGVSLRRALANPNNARDRAIVIPYRGANEGAVVTRDWRYIVYGDGSEELYHQPQDPHEWYNLADDAAYQPVIADLRSHLPTNWHPYEVVHKQGGLRANNDGTWSWRDDRVKVHASFLSSAPAVVDGPFDVTLEFSVDVTGFRLNDLDVTNGTVSNLRGNNDDRYIFRVTPDSNADGEILLIELPDGSVTGVPDDREDNEDVVALSRRIDFQKDSLEAPVARATWTQTDALTVDFDSSRSRDDGSIVRRLWQFGDGTLSTGRNPTHVFPSAGTYLVTFGVTDDDGLGSELITLSVTVTDDDEGPEPLPDPPTYGNGGDAWKLRAGRSLRLEAENYDLGGEGVAYQDTTSGNERGEYRRDDVDIDDEGAGFVVEMRGGEWLTYTIDVAEAGEYTIDALVARQGASKQFRVSVGNEQSGRITVPDTGGYHTWVTVSGSLQLSAGEQVLRLTADSGRFDIDYLTLRPAVEPPPTLPDPPTYGNGGDAWALRAGRSLRLEAENYDLGGEGVAYQDTTSGNERGEYRRDDVDIDDGGSGFVVEMRSGEWLTYTIDVAEAGEYTIDALVARQGASKQFRVSVEGERSGPLTVPDTGSYQNWVTVGGSLRLPAGEQVLRLTADSGRFDIDYLTLRPAAEPPPPQPNPPTYGNGGDAWALRADRSLRLEAENYDLGGEGVAYHDTTNGNGREEYRRDDVDIDDGGSGFVVEMRGGEWLTYTIDVAEAGTYTIDALVARQGSSKQFRVSAGGERSGRITVPDTGSYQNWVTVSGSLELSAGEQVLRVTADSGRFDIDYFTLTRAVEPRWAVVPDGPTILITLNNGLDVDLMPHAGDPDSIGDPLVNASTVVNTTLTFAELTMDQSNMFTPLPTNGEGKSQDNNWWFHF